MTFNPFAVVFWVLCGIVGYFIGALDGALAGIGIGIVFSFLLSAVNYYDQ